VHADLLARTRDLIAGCGCEHGCPTCVGPIGNTGPLAKIVALRILEVMAGPSRASGEELPCADVERALPAGGGEMQVDA